MSLIDYYQVLEVDRGADAETIKHAVRTKRTEWRRKANHPKQDVRALAERYTQNISDAEAVLLDPARRSAFDRQLAAHVEPPVAAPEADGGRDWLAVAREHLFAGRPAQAHLAAREATGARPADAEAWYVRGVASGLLDNAADAEFELTEAIRLDPAEPSYHCELGDLLRSHGLAARAQAAYQRASDLDPENLFYRVGVAASLTGQGKLAEALPILERAVEADPGNELFAYHYAIALADSTTEQWSQYADGSRSILTGAQLALTQRNLATIRRLPVNDPELRNHLDEISVHGERAGRVSWHGSSNLVAYGVGFFVALIAGISAFGMASQSAGAALVGVLLLGLAVLIPYVFVRRHRMTGWAWEARQSPDFVRRSGLQGPGA